jgi:hypothetical protein
VFGTAGSRPPICVPSRSNCAHKMEDSTNVELQLQRPTCCPCCEARAPSRQQPRLGGRWRHPVVYNLAWSRTTACGQHQFGREGRQLIQTCGMCVAGCGSAAHASSACQGSPSQPLPLSWVSATIRTLPMSTSWVPHGIPARQQQALHLHPTIVPTALCDKNGHCFTQARPVSGPKTEG